MSPLDAAMHYAARGWPVFPCVAKEGPARKRPLTPRGFHDASIETAVINAWWRRNPDALIGMPTGRKSGLWVLDIDVKQPEANGFDSLDDLGHSILPETPMVHTASGGLHVYFDARERELRCSAGLLGPGLDIRGDGGYVILPSPGSGYRWDPQWNFGTILLAPAPDWIWPPKISRPASAEPIQPVTGLSPYGAAAIEAACNAIFRAPPGKQERTLNAECFSIGTLAGARAVPENIALSALLRAGNAMPDHEASRPWRPEEIDLKVRRAFYAGMRQPREARRGVA
jgi:Bifunctional DNA primase/polymerase, N-terminal